MAFFNLRWPGIKRRDDKTPVVAPPDSVEVMRRRARHRLIGAAVLVLLGVIGFPLLFDTQPRPGIVDIPITIPDRETAPALVVPDNESSAPSTSGPVVSEPVPIAPPTPVPTVQDLDASDQEQPFVKPEAPPVKPPKLPPPLVESTKPAIKKDKPPPQPKPVDQSVRSNEAARVQALLDGKSADTDTATARIVVQVGAFSDPDKAREVRIKLEHAGLKTYTHIAQTQDGPRTRVRVGPFANRMEADRAVQKIKKLDLSASILVL